MQKEVKPYITVHDSEITQKVIVEHYFWCCMVITPGIRNSYFMQAPIIISSAFSCAFRYFCFMLLCSNIFLAAAAAATKTCISLLSDCLCVKPNTLQDLFNHFFFLKRSLAVYSRKLLRRKILWESLKKIIPNPCRSISILSHSGKVSPAAGTTRTDLSTTDKFNSESQEWEQFQLPSSFSFPNKAHNQEGSRLDLAMRCSNLVLHQRHVCLLSQSFLGDDTSFVKALLPGGARVLSSGFLLKHIHLTITAIKWSTETTLKRFSRSSMRNSHLPNIIVTTHERKSSPLLHNPFCKAWRNHHLKSGKKPWHWLTTKAQRN